MFKLPDIFLREEERDGFLIPEMMKRAWATQMSVLSEFDHVCRKYNLTYFALAGTMLGAVRHKGYIPWDDDIDIGMPRKDYMIFLSIAKDELPEEFVIHSFYTSENQCSPISSIMNRHNIGYDSLTEKYFGFPYITGFDLFPLDYVPADPQEENILHGLYGLIYDTALEYTKWQEAGELEERLALIEELTNQKIHREDGNICQQLWMLSEGIATMYTREESKGLAWIGYLVSDSFDRWFTFECFNEVIYVPFESIQIPIPKGYDEYLTKVYGDYMTPVKMGALHEYPFYKEQEQILREAIQHAK